MHSRQSQRILQSSQGHKAETAAADKKTGLENESLSTQDLAVQAYTSLLRSQAILQGTIPDEAMLTHQARSRHLYQKDRLIEQADLIFALEEEPALKAILAAYNNGDLYRKALQVKRNTYDSIDTYKKVRLAGIPLLASLIKPAATIAEYSPLAAGLFFGAFASAWLGSFVLPGVVKKNAKKRCQKAKQDLLRDDTFLSIEENRRDVSRTVDIGLSTKGLQALGTLKEKYGELLYCTPGT